MDEFKSNINQFINCDNTIKNYNERICAMREQKESYGNRIMSFMNSNNMSNTKLQLDKYNSTLKIGLHTQQESISYSFLLETFTEYFSSKEQAEHLLGVIKEKRGKKPKQVLVRNIYKK